MPDHTSESGRRLLSQLLDVVIRIGGPGARDPIRSPLRHWSHRATEMDCLERKHALGVFSMDTLEVVGLC